MWLIFDVLEELTLYCLVVAKVREKLSVSKLAAKDLTRRNLILEIQIMLRLKFRIGL
jgi:hypothetical protein